MPTSKDVAAAAGVSQSTVSYVMSGKRPISEKTRLRVEAAIEQLTYQPNAGARALASRKSQVIGLVISITPEAHLGSLMEFIAVIAATARRHDYDVLLVTDEEGSQGLERVVGQQLCDGLILMQVEADDERIPVVRKLRVPVVFIGIPNDSAGLNCIDADFARAGELCVEEMAAAGHTSGVIIGWRPRLVGSRLNYVGRFLGGAEAAAERLNVKIKHVPAAPDRASVEAAVEACIAEADGRPAFVSPDATVLELLPRILRERGLEPGKDASVIGVGPTPEALIELQESTVLDIQPKVVSRRAVEILFSLMQADNPDRGGLLELIPPLVTHRYGTADPHVPAAQPIH
ncbi:DNA-binding LacI/PurR family transcriptional regulator [Arthrobacter pascens]|uniref:LacI family DNA-binding transcriptional regulator n=1 Tax=Arthrobacter pascens TaxID=1677 RepID=UPI002783B4AD|nr:LacI family DNA-binding transcriptional regulator [Arthrobacter pascens]MDQ0632340.1 DNA-binding LacI/PurR family transcriptional regulator [Arthrobacter pascens]